MSYATLRPRPASCAVLLLALALPSSGCDGDSTGPNDFLAEDSFSFTLEVTALNRLSVEATNGNITASGEAGSDSLRVEGVRQVWSSSQADADAHLSSLQVSIDENPDGFLLSTDQPDETAGRTYVVHYEITLPADFELLIVNANGNITVAAIEDDVSIANANGEVRLDEILGNVSVQLGNGDIDAEVTLPLGGFLSLALGNGDIVLSIPQSTSAEFSANVGNGSITVVDLALETEDVSATSVSGILSDGQGTIVLAVGNGRTTVIGF